MNARDIFMTTRSTRRTVPLAIAVTAVVFAWLVDASPRAVAAPAAVAAATAASGQAATPVVAPGTTQYAVKPGQSLADIAVAATQSHDKAVLSRAAKVIFDANPSAFSRGDPSLLKLGAVLNVPPLDATGALANSAPEPAAAPTAASTPSAASTAAAASQAAGAGVKASGAQPATPASAPAAAVSQASAGTAASAAAKPAATAATHQQANGPAAVAGGHAWSGAIEPAPSAPSSAPAEGAASATQASAASATPAAVASQPAAGGTATAGASAVATASAAGTAATAGASAAAAPALSASHPKVSSLQQLLTLKNRVLMELQRHGFGTSSSNRSGATSNAPVGASGFAATPPASGVVAPAPGPSRAAAAANQRFISVGGYGVARDDIPAIAAVAAAVAAALLVLLVALGISRRKRRAAVPSVASAGGAASAAPAADQGESAQPLAKPATGTDDPIEAEFLSVLARNPTSKRALMGLAGHYAERGNVRGFDEIAQRIYRLSGGRGPNWVHVAALGRQLDPDNPLFALQATESEESAESEGSGLAETPEGGLPAQTESEASASSEWPHASEPELLPRAEPPVERPPEGTVVPELTDVIGGTPPAVEPQPEPEAAPQSRPTSQLESTPAIESAPEATTEPPAARPEPEHEQEQLEGESSEASSASRHDATLPPEAVAALDALDLGLPPRAELSPDAPARPHDIGDAETPEPTEPESARSEPWPEVTAEAAPHELHGEPSAQREPNANAAHEPGEKARSEPLPPPNVTGLGAAPIGPLKLSFNLDLPGADGGEGAMAAAAPLPQFTPEQLAKIARNKLDLAAEYIALGDLGGARTLIHEVIESNDAATREDAHALLATLAPLS